MVEVKRKPGESTESLVRRFTRRIRQSQVLIQIKETKFHRPPESKRLKKENALRRKKIREKKEYLRKIGSLEEQTNYNARR